MTLSTLISGFLLTVVTLFNPQQSTVSLYNKDTIEPGTYKIRVHANVPIEKAEIQTQQGSCNVSWQNAVCTVNFEQPVSKNFIASFKLQKKEDWHYIVDFSNSDEAVRPVPAILNTENLNNNINQTNNSQKNNQIVTKTVMKNKKTGIETFFIFAFFIILIITAIRLYNITKE